MNRVLLLSLLASASAYADAIGGTFSSTFQGFNEYGVPTVRLSLQLTCSLIPCPVTKPQHHYAVAGATNAHFLAEPSERVGYVSAFFGSEPTGNNVVDSTQFPPGSAFQLLAKSVTCWCGNANGEGGYLDLTATTVIPPWIVTTGSPPRAGDDWAVLLAAMPKGSETVQLRVVGAGLDETHTLAPADFSSGSGMKFIHPTQPGALNLTATLLPHGASTNATVTVVGSGSSTGGGTAGTGGGMAGGGSDPQPEPGPCSVAPGSFGLLALASLWWRRRVKAA